MESRLSEHGCSEGCLSKIGTDEARLGEVCEEFGPMEVCIAEFRFKERCRNNLHLGENSFTKIGCGEICTSKVWSRSRIRVEPLVPARDPLLQASKVFIVRHFVTLLRW